MKAMLPFIGDPALAAEYVAQLTVSSLSVLGTSFEAEETWKAAGAGAAAGWKTGKGRGKIVGAIGGAWAGATGAMETGLTLTDLLKEELHAKGIDPNDFENGFTDVNIMGILEDPEAIERIKKKSLARGLTMAAVEGLTLGLSRGVATSVLRKTGSKTKAIGAATLTEGAGGAFGEAAGQVATGAVAEPDGFDLQKGLENIDSREVFLEGIAELPGGVFSTDIVSESTEKIKGRQYKINGGDATKNRVLSIIKDTELSTAEKAKILSNVEIKNDSALQESVNSALSEIDIELNIDSRVSDIDNRKRLVELEKKRRQAEGDVKKTGVFSVPDAQANLDNINSQIKEVLNTTRSN